MLNTQSLRTKILDLAMRGQLTEQLPTDGTAEDLYLRIQAEKQAMIRTGKIKKEKSLPPIGEDEIPFEVPKGWKWCRLGEIGSWGAGATPSRMHPEYYKGNIPWLKTGDLNDNYINEVPEYISELALQNTSVRLNPVGSVLIAMYGATIGKLGILNVPMTTNQACCACIPFTGVYNKYLFYYLMKKRIDFIKMGKGGAQPNISKEIITNYPFPLPPLAEQQRIVSRIEAAFAELDVIDKLQAAYNKNREVLRKKLIDAAIHGELTQRLPGDGDAEDLYQKIQAEKQAMIKNGMIKKEKPLPPIGEDEIPFEVPKGWKWCRLGDVCQIYGGKRIPAGRSLITENTGHKYIRISDMKNNSVITSGLLYVPEDIYPVISQYIIRSEDIYITVAGTIGRIGKIPKEIDGANLTENADRVVFKHLNQDWLINCLLSSSIQKQIEKLTTSVAQPKLAIKRIIEFVIPLPPLAEQQRIVARLGELLGALG